MMASAGCPSRVPWAVFLALSAACAADAMEPQLVTEKSTVMPAPCGSEEEGGDVTAKADGESHSVDRAASLQSESTRLLGPQGDILIEEAADFGILRLIPKRLSHLEANAPTQAAMRVLLPLFAGNCDQEWAAELEFDLCVGLTPLAPLQNGAGGPAASSASYQLVSSGQVVKSLQPGARPERVPLLRRAGERRLRLAYEPCPSIVADIAIRLGPQAPALASVRGEIFLSKGAAERAAQKLVSQALDLSRVTCGQIGHVEAVSNEAGVGENASFSRWRAEMQLLQGGEATLPLVAEIVHGENFSAMQALPAAPKKDHPSIPELFAQARFDMERQALQGMLESWRSLDEDIHLFYAIQDNIGLH